jgi:hypothetical protein
MAAAIVNRLLEIGRDRPKVQSILDTLGTRIELAAKEVTDHWNKHEKFCKSTEFTYWGWELLGRDGGEHTGSNCKSCQEQNLQAAVYGRINIDEHGNPLPPVHRKRQTARRDSVSKDFVGYICKAYGILEAVTAQDVVASNVGGAALEAQTNKATQAGYSEGLRDSKRVNEEHMVQSATLEWQGNTMSLGAMQDRHMGSHNTVQGSRKKAKKRKEQIASGEKKRRSRAGPWGKDEENRRLLFAELDK